MSVFDQFDKNLPGDRKMRKVKAQFENFEYEQSEEIETKPQRAYWIFYVLALIIMGVLLAQLLHLQITLGAFNRTLAQGNRLRDRTIPAPRGVIYSSNGTALVTNDASFSLEIYPLDLPKKGADRDAFYKNLSTVIQIPQEEIKNKVEGQGSSQAAPVVLKENIDRDSALLLETKITNSPGVVIGINPVRDYKQITGLSQIIGYVGKVTEAELKNNPQFQMNETVGKDGLEKTYEEYLKGKDGSDLIEVDSHGRAQRTISNLAPQPGDSLTLTINNDLEEEMAKALQAGLDSAGVKAGAAVAMDPKTGAILGMVSLPTYDNNVFTGGVSQDEYQKLVSDPNQPMFNRAISGTYPSGSTIKPTIAAAGLQDGVITENTTINDTGEIKVGNYVYPDWKAHGLVDVRKAIAVSANVFFYAVGGGWDKIKGLGVQKLHDYLASFGFGKKLGIDLPGEANGLVPDPNWKTKVQHQSWYLGDTYHMSIGQGDMLVTPLQMVNSVAAIANGGSLLKPYIVQKITDQDGKVVTTTQKTVINSNFINDSNLQIVREGMRNCVDASYGSGRALSSLPIAVAAKTGTAQFGSEGKTHAWMTAFAPYNDPQIAIAVIVEGGGEGYASAGPVVQNIFNWYFTR